MLLQEEIDLDCMYCSRSLEVFRPLTSVTVDLESRCCCNVAANEFQVYNWKVIVQFGSSYIGTCRLLSRKEPVFSGFS